MSDSLLYEIEDRVAWLTLNRPEKRNALNGDLVAALKEGLNRAAADPEVRLVALGGAGKDFCSGADLAELERIADMGEEENLEDARSLGALFRQMRRHPNPIVGIVRGRALAGGCGLASACDLVLATDDAELASLERTAEVTAATLGRAEAARTLGREEAAARVERELEREPVPEGLHSRCTSVWRCSRTAR